MSSYIRLDQLNYQTSVTTVSRTNLHVAPQTPPAISHPSSSHPAPLSTFIDVDYTAEDDDGSASTPDHQQQQEPTSSVTTNNHQQVADNDDNDVGVTSVTESRDDQDAT